MVSGTGKHQAEGGAWNNQDGEGVKHQLSSFDLALPKQRVLVNQPWRSKLVEIMVSFTVFLLL